MEVDRFAGIAGPHVVAVHAVGSSAGRGQARRHERLSGDVPPDDVVDAVVELRGDEVMVIDAVDLQGGDNVGERRRSVCHPGIMPQLAHAERFGR